MLGGTAPLRLFIFQSAVKDVKQVKEMTTFVQQGRRYNNFVVVCVCLYIHKKISISLILRYLQNFECFNTPYLSWDRAG